MFWFLTESQRQKSLTKLTPFTEEDYHEKDRITREKEMLPEMVKIYCHGVHKSKKVLFARTAKNLLIMRFSGLTIAAGETIKTSARNVPAIATNPICE